MCLKSHTCISEWSTFGLKMAVVKYIDEDPYIYRVKLESTTVHA